MLWHWERLEAGLKQLGFRVPELWSAAFFEQEILRITAENARVRLSVWRSPGGLFYPTSKNAEYLVTTSPLENARFELNKTGLRLQQCERVRLPVDGLSGLKTLGGTRYVAAAMEAHEKGVDDVVVLNAHGMICETSNSNILWISKGIVFAPSPADGQVTGTFQKILSGVLQAEGIKIVQKPATFEALKTADEVMLTNAIQGIRWVQFLEGTEYTCENIIYFNKLMAKYLERFLR